MEILRHLAEKPTGDSLENLRQLFYEPAKAKHPEIFRDYQFGPYLAFLERNGLITVVEGRATITPAGREYLEWRKEARRPTNLQG